MTSLERFLAYFQAFELTYIDDDWSRLEIFMAPDVVYSVVGDVSWACEIKGRAAVLAGMRKFLDEFDRQCTRKISPVGLPRVEGETVRVGGTAAYRRGDSEPLVLEIELVAEYRDGLLVALRDVYPPGNADRAKDWLARFGQGLNAAYV